MQESSAGAALSDQSGDATSSVVIVNGDDWGMEARTTDRLLDCARHHAISSVSAMVYMADSERAAGLAREHGVDAGLHLNLTHESTAGHCPARLKEEQAKLGKILRRHRYAPTIYHPGLAAAFEYVVKTQLEEYERLYGVPARRIDGHQHMHLSSNVIFQRLLPAGTIVRRNLTYATGERAWLNRFYRAWQDRRLARRHVMADCFFDLVPAEARRLERICTLGRRFDVEIETHVIRDGEYKLLMEGALSAYAGGTTVARGFVLRGGRKGGSVHE